MVRLFSSFSVIVVVAAGAAGADAVAVVGNDDGDLSEVEIPGVISS